MCLVGRDAKLFGHKRREATVLVARFTFRTLFAFTSFSILPTGSFICSKIIFGQNRCEINFMLNMTLF